MPKLKTKSGAKKRFKVTATGKVMHAQRGKRCALHAEPAVPRILQVQNRAALVEQVLGQLGVVHDSSLP